MRRTGVAPFQGRSVLPLLAALLLGGGSALAQEAGDRVELVLRSGRSYTGTLVASGERAVTLRLGSSEVELPRSMVADMRKLDPPAPAKDPEPGRETESARPGSPSSAGAGPAAAPAADSADGSAGTGLPRPTSILLKDGSLVEGYVLSREEGRLWILPAKPREVRMESVDEIFGDAEPMGGGGLRITGDAARDTKRLVRELGSSELARATAAAAALESYGDEAVPALLDGLRTGTTKTRLICVGIIVARRPDGAVDPLLDIVKNDREPAVRSEAAKALLYYDGPQVRRALLESIWRDPSEDVRYAAALPLKRIATVEEVSAMLDLLSILPPESPALSPLYEALRRAAGQKLGDDRQIWVDWWETGGGREAISDLVSEAITRRMMEMNRPR